MSLFSWLLPKRFKSPGQLYKEKEDREFIEAIKRSAIITRGSPETGYSLSNLGMSEYGAEKQLESGEEPPWFNRKVLTKDGDLIDWDEWKSSRNK